MDSGALGGRLGLAYVGCVLLSKTKGRTSASLLAALQQG